MDISVVKMWGKLYAKVLSNLHACYNVRYAFEIIMDFKVYVEYYNIQQYL